MSLLMMDFILVIGLMTGSVLSHVENTRDILANNSLEFSTSPTDEITTLISTDRWVFHMEPDLRIPGNILFSDGHALKTTDGIASSTIAGSPIHMGNTVAVGQLARFGQIRGFRQISPTHVVVVDYGYHCLRLVDRLTLQTPRYAGYCGSSGYSQGTTSARFNGPYGIIDDKKRAGMLLMTDRNNDAIRHVQVTVGSGLSSVSEFYKSSTLDGPNCLTQDLTSGDIYITTYLAHRVFRLTYATRFLSLVAGSSSGFADGDFGSSRFRDQNEIAFIDDGRKLVLTDHGNHRLRLLDLTTRQSSSLCTGQSGHSDGDMFSCTLTWPHSLMVLNNTLYVGEYQRIRKIPGKPVPLCEEREYVISPETGLALVELPGPGGTTKLSLPPGSYPISLDYSSVNCTMVLHVSDHREIACPTLEERETANSDTGVAIVDVPLCGSRKGELSLRPGSHSLHITSDNFNCTVEYNISDYRESPCARQQIRQSASPDTRVALVDMALSGLEGKLSLPPGNYPFKIESDRGSCTVDIGVADHRLRRRLVFQAQYDVECEPAEGNIAESPLTLIVARHAFDYAEICDADCGRPVDAETRLKCTNHTLTVVWPSNLTYTGDVNRIPAELDQRLTSRIVAKGSALYLLLPEVNPPIAFPEQVEHGGYVMATFSSYCIGEDVGYVKDTDACGQQTDPDILEM